jgi:predicted PurR-regulated permease PerM
MERLRALVHGTLLVLIIGWVFYIGQVIIVPAVLGAVIVYVIVGLSQVLARLPRLGPLLPLQLRNLVSVLVIGLAFLLLASIQQVAVYFGIETEPTWAMLRQELMARVNLQRLITSLMASVGSVLLTFVVVCLYATFLMVERRSFNDKLANLSADAARVARIRDLVAAINQRIGSYLALKTLLSLLLAAVSYGVMALFGLEFAGLFAVLTGFLNFVPYIGSVLGVLMPGLVALVQFQDPGSILTLLLALTVVQFVIGNFLDPWVMGRIGRSNELLWIFTHYYPRALLPRLIRLSRTHLPMGWCRMYWTPPAASTHPTRGGDTNAARRDTAHPKARTARNACSTSTSSLTRLGARRA